MSTEIKFTKDELIPLMENGKMPNKGEYPRLREALEFLGVKDVTIICTDTTKGREWEYSFYIDQFCRELKIDREGYVYFLGAEEEDEGLECRVKDAEQFMKIYNEAIQYALLFQNYEMMLTPYAIKRYAGRVLDADPNWYDTFDLVKKGYVVKKLNPQQWEALTRYYTPQKFVSRPWRKYAKSEYVVTEAEKAVVITESSFRYVDRYAREPDLVKGDVVFVEDKEGSVKYTREWSIDCMD